MDTSTSAAQDVQTQQSSDDQQVKSNVQGSPVNRLQSPSQDQSSQQQTPQPKNSGMISVGSESGSAMIAQENSDDDEDEDELVAPQETKNLGVMGQGEEESEEQQIVAQPGGGSIEMETVELQPAIPEVVTSSPEVEKVIEKTGDQDRPKISQELRDAGVTHSGPGIIDIGEIQYKKAEEPEISYSGAVAQVKQSHLHDSKHWVMAMVMYIWRKLHPGIEKEEAATITQGQPAEVPATIEAVEARSLDDSNGQMVK